jgi:hypothetical protein
MCGNFGGIEPHSIAAPIPPCTLIGRVSQRFFDDLNHVFDLVNREYFRGQMAKPQLAWSQVFIQRKFGHYEPARDRLVISLTLDQQRIPRDVVEFVMYHELLHKHHGERWSNGRCLVHTPQLRRDESNFKHYQLAQQWLERLAKH